MLRAHAALRFAGVLGWPLEHSLSPVIHNAAFRALGLEWIYLSWPVPPKRLGAAVEGLRALGAEGANVTMPHKETVIEYVDGLSGDAEAIGAVNTIAAGTKGLTGHNTDVAGFADFLTRNAGITVAGRSVLLLGAGGAARAVLKALSDLGAAGITVAARSEARAQELSAMAGRALGLEPELVSWEEAPKRARDCELLVNATPVGMAGEDSLPGAELEPDQVVVDLIYSPPSTPLVDKARAAGASAWGGLGMLVGQAAASFRIWTGQEPPLEAMSAAAVRAIGSHSV